MTADLEAIRESYDTVAVDYAELLRDALAAAPHARAVLGLFAELVLAGGGGPVADVGCGPGRITVHLARLGLDAFGVDLSPGMVEVARRDHPGLRFAVGSLTDLAVADGALAGALAWYSIIHTPTDDLPGVLAELARVLRPGGELLIAFQVGAEPVELHNAYGHEVRLVNHRRPPALVEQLVTAAGLTVHTRLFRDPEAGERSPQAYLLARRQVC